MNTESARITRKQAAVLAGVSDRTVSRWSALGWITPQHAPVGSREPSTYDPAEVLAAKERWLAAGGRPRRSSP